PESVVPPGNESCAGGTTRGQHGRVTPLAPRRHALHVTIGDGSLDMLEHIQSLLSHQVPSGDLEQVLEHAFAAAIVELERRKLANTRRPRTPRARRPVNSNSPHIPAHV